MKLAVVGSRSITDQDAVNDAIAEVVNQYAGNYPVGTVILSGGAKGVQACAKKYAEEFSGQFVAFEPYHEIDKKAKFNPKYFYTRNVPLIANADVVLAIWDGTDPNTDHAIQLARQLKKHLVIEIPDNQEDYVQTT